MRIKQWDDWYAIEAAAREADGALISSQRPETVRLQLWIPDTYVARFAEETTDLDTDLRRGAVLLPSRLFSPRAFPFAPLLNLPDPISPLDGRLELVSARREGSLLSDLMAIGAIVGPLVDVPTLFFMIRAATRRIPFRIRFERRDADPEQQLPVEPIAGHFSDRQAELVEAARIKRRITVDHPSGAAVIVEEFE